MSATPQAPDFQTLLAEESRELRAFLQLLENERNVLMQRSVDPLASIADEKNRASARLQAMGTRRMQWLASHGVGHGAEDMEHWLTESPDRETRLGLWQNFVELARQARDLNHANGTLIRTRMQYGQQALAVLLAAANQASFYSPDGHSLSSLGKRHLGSA